MNTNLTLQGIIVCLLFCGLVNAQKTSPNFRLFYLGGQSNMDGFGYNKELPDSLNTTIENVYIYHGNPAVDGQSTGGLGIWEKLKPGHGVGFSSDGAKNGLSDRFGPELSFAKKMKSFYPNDKIAIIKYSKGGTSIDSMANRKPGSWEPDYNSKKGINQYDHFLTTMRNALKNKDIDNDGVTDVLVPSCIVWMQGESDADTEAIANRYLFNLKRLMDLIRASMLTDDLPIVIGKISDSWDNERGKVHPYGELIQHAQEAFVKSEKNAAIVRDTRYYKFSDKWHYDTFGYIDMGKRFADEAYKLLEKESE